jgi:hypothetical protein
VLSPPTPTHLPSLTRTVRIRNPHIHPPTQQDYRGSMRIPITPHPVLRPVQMRPEIAHVLAAQEMEAYPRAAGRGLEEPALLVYGLCGSAS